MSMRALGLLSGGLDSQLAACMLRDQGIAVEALTFRSPFFEPRRAIAAAAALGIPHRVEDFTADILELVEHPRHGFGSEMNPCIDCHGRMLMRAGQLLEKTGCRFLFTGEVLGQRPMSQNIQALATVAKDSGYGDRILRPLCARLLPETEMERLGWVDRTRLLDISGRSRRAQYALATRFGIKDLPPVAGGCRLTEPNYAGRLRDLRDHEGLHDAMTLALLRHGRHFRLPGGYRLVVGRDAADNDAIEGLRAPTDVQIAAVDVPGPVALLRGVVDEDAVRLAATICARYSDIPADGEAAMEIQAPGGSRRLTVAPAARDAVDKLRIA